MYTKEILITPQDVAENKVVFDFNQDESAVCVNDLLSWDPSVYKTDYGGRGVTDTSAYTLGILDLMYRAEDLIVAVYRTQLVIPYQYHIPIYHYLCILSLHNHRQV